MRKIVLFLSFFYVLFCHASVKVYTNPYDSGTGRFVAAVVSECKTDGVYNMIKFSHLYLFGVSSFEGSYTTKHGKYVPFKYNSHRDKLRHAGSISEQVVFEYMPHPNDYREEYYYRGTFAFVESDDALYIVNVETDEIICELSLRPYNKGYSIDLVVNPNYGYFKIITCTDKGDVDIYDANQIRDALTNISDVRVDISKKNKVYNLDGTVSDNSGKGIKIIIDENGQAKKVIK